MSLRPYGLGEQTPAARREEVLGLTRITKQKIKELCKRDKLYQTPGLNDVLYLHYQGFQNIECLEDYTGLKCIWLDSNAICEITGLTNQTKLKCLFLQNNLITRIENLEQCAELDTLNLSHNRIHTIENCSSDKLPVLNSLYLEKNYLKTAQDLAQLVNCAHLSVLDLSNNRIDDITVVKIFGQMPSLRVLNLMYNPVVSIIPQYRRTLTLECKELTYLDARPVFPKDRACAEAWKRGGYEEERKESDRWIRADRKRIRDSVNATIRLRNRYRPADQQTDEIFSSDEDESEAAVSKRRREHNQLQAQINIDLDIWDEVGGKDTKAEESSATDSSDSDSDEGPGDPNDDIFVPKPKKPKPQKSQAEKNADLEKEQKEKYAEAGKVIDKQSDKESTDMENTDTESTDTESAEENKSENAEGNGKRDKIENEAKDINEFSLINLSEFESFDKILKMDDYKHNMVNEIDKIAAQGSMEGICKLVADLNQSDDKPIEGEAMQVATAGQINIDILDEVAKIDIKSEESGTTHSTDFIEDIGDQNDNILMTEPEKLQAEKNADVGIEQNKEKLAEDSKVNVGKESAGEKTEDADQNDKKDDEEDNAIADVNENINEASFLQPKQNDKILKIDDAKQNMDDAKQNMDDEIENIAAEGGMEEICSLIADFNQESDEKLIEEEAIQVTAVDRTEIIKVWTAAASDGDQIDGEIEGIMKKCDEIYKVNSVKAMSDVPDLVTDNDESQKPNALEVAYAGVLITEEQIKRQRERDECNRKTEDELTKFTNNMNEFVSELHDTEEQWNEGLDGLYDSSDSETEDDENMMMEQKAKVKHIHNPAEKSEKNDQPEDESPSKPFVKSVDFNPMKLDMARVEYLTDIDCSEIKALNFTAQDLAEEPDVPLLDFLNPEKKNAVVEAWESKSKCDVPVSFQMKIDRETEDLRQLLQKMEDDNERLYPCTESDEPEQIVKDVVRDFVGHLELKQKCFEFTDLESDEEYSYSVPNNTPSKPVKCIRDVTGGFRKLICDITKKHKEELEAKEREFNERVCKATTTERKNETLKLNSDSMMDFHEATKEELDERIVQMKEREQERIKGMVDRVYTQKDMYDNTLEVIDGKLVVIQKETGVANNLPAREVCESPNDSDLEDMIIAAREKLKGALAQEASQSSDSKCSHIPTVQDLQDNGDNSKPRAEFCSAEQTSIDNTDGNNHDKNKFLVLSTDKPSSSAVTADLVLDKPASSAVTADLVLDGCEKGMEKMDIKDSDTTTEDCPNNNNSDKPLENSQDITHKEESIKQISTDYLEGYSYNWRNYPLFRSLFEPSTPIVECGSQAASVNAGDSLDEKQDDTSEPFSKEEITPPSTIKSPTHKDNNFVGNDDLPFEKKYESKVPLTKNTNNKWLDDFMKGAANNDNDNASDSDDSDVDYFSAKSTGSGRYADIDKNFFDSLNSMKSRVEESDEEELAKCTRSYTELRKFAKDPKSDHVLTNEEETMVKLMMQNAEILETEPPITAQRQKEDELLDKMFERQLAIEAEDTDKLEKDCEEWLAEATLPTNAGKGFEKECVSGNLHSEDIPSDDENILSKPTRMQCREYVFKFRKDSQQVKTLYETGKFVNPIEADDELEDENTLLQFAQKLKKKKIYETVSSSSGDETKKSMTLDEIINEKPHCSKAFSIWKSCETSQQPSSTYNLKAPKTNAGCQQPLPSSDDDGQGVEAQRFITKYKTGNQTQENAKTDAHRSTPKYSTNSAIDEIQHDQNAVKYENLTEGDTQVVSSQCYKDIAEYNRSQLKDGSETNSDVEDIADYNMNLMQVDAKIDEKDKAESQFYSNDAFDNEITCPLTHSRNAIFQDDTKMLHNLVSITKFDWPVKTHDEDIMKQVTHEASTQIEKVEDGEKFDESLLVRPQTAIELNDEQKVESFPKKFGPYELFQFNISNQNQNNNNELYQVVTQNQEDIPTTSQKAAVAMDEASSPEVFQYTSDYSSDFDAEVTKINGHSEIVDCTLEILGDDDGDDTIMDTVSATAEIIYNVEDANQ